MPAAARAAELGDRGKQGPVGAQAGGRGESLLLRAYTALVEGVNVVEALPPSHPSRMQSHASLLVMLQYVAKVPLVCARVCTCAE